MKVHYNGRLILPCRIFCITVLKCRFTVENVTIKVTNADEITNVHDTVLKLYSRLSCVCVFVDTSTGEEQKEFLLICSSSSFQQHSCLN